MPRIFIQYLEGNNIYICRKCGAHFTKLSSLISESFSGGSGTAFLFNEVINVKEGKPQQKKMITGLHLVCDIFCVGCNSDKPIGWKYIKAHNPSQVYKEGKFILQVAYLRKQSWIEFDD